MQIQTIFSFFFLLKKYHKYSDYCFVISTESPEIVTMIQNMKKKKKVIPNEVTCNDSIGANNYVLNRF